MKKELKYIMRYMVTPFEVLGVSHALAWGFAGGFALGILVGFAIGIS